MKIKSQHAKHSIENKGVLKETHTALSPQIKKFERTEITKFTTWPRYISLGYRFKILYLTLYVH